MPRVISGRAGSIQLSAPTGNKTRPTADKTKEGMFNVLQSRINFAGLAVLDLFAGSGQLAIEALSRGAAHAVLVDKAAPARKIQLANLQKTNFTKQAELLTCDVNVALRKLSENQEKFDLIFIDPPYADLSQFWHANAEKLANLLAENGILIIEGDFATELTQDVTDLKFFKHCHYGSTMVLFYMKDINND